MVDEDGGGPSRTRGDVRVLTINAVTLANMPSTNSDTVHHDHRLTAPPTAQPMPQSYWFHDGSVIVSLQGSRFKLHESLLVRHSPYFSSIASARGGVGEVIAIPDERTDVESFTALLGQLYHDV